MTTSWSPSLSKITRPTVSDILQRERLFLTLDEARSGSVTWLCAPAGSGKTTLAASWLDSRKLPCLWYQVDEGDGDLATFFYYMGLAGKKAAPKHKKPLPLLTPEYLLGIPAFTRRYFEDLYNRLIGRGDPMWSPKKGQPRRAAPTTIVLDNYQDAPGPAFHEMTAHALEVVPEGVNVVIISRVEPPAQLSRLRAGRKMRIIGWNEIRLTIEETQMMLEGEGCRLSDEAVTALQDKTDGWAAGLVLMMEKARRGELETNAKLKTQGEMFDYFANEVFNRADEAARDLLLKTSFLQKIEPDVAEKLTGIASAGKILERLSREHYFTQKQGEAYQYHPLFREFLLAHAGETFSPPEISSIQTRTASLLEERGEIEEACALYLEAGDWPTTVRLILTHAPVMSSQGRSGTLNSWIEALPRDIRENDPWLLYWLAVGRMAFAPGESRVLLESAFERFKGTKDTTGIFLSWASIIDTFNYEWGDFSPLDHWIAVLEELLRVYPEMPSPEIEVRVAAGMLIAMMNRQPGHPDISKWADKVERVVLATDNVQLQMALGSQLVHSYIWVGNPVRCGSLIETLRQSVGSRKCDPLAKQYWYLMESMYSWIVADWPSCKRAVTDGMKNAQESGVHIFDLFILANGIYGGLSLGEPAFARSCLEGMLRINSPRRGDKGLVHYQAASVAWYGGDLKNAVEHAELAVRTNEESGWPFVQAITLLNLSLTYFDDGRFDEAEATLAKSLALCRGVMLLLECWGSLNGARFAFERGRDKDGAALLERGLSLAAMCDVFNIPRWNDSRMSRLCAEALERGIEVDYVLKLIKKRELLPPDAYSSNAPDSVTPSLTPLNPPFIKGGTTGGLGGVVNWPYPIRIYTLGRFEIVIDGKPVESQGKVQKKPLEMLKAIIAFGGRDVSEEQLTDALWPDADGDTAHKSFEVNLLRLRRLLGNDKVLRFRDGKVTLDTGFCWTDVLAFESIVKPSHQKEDEASIGSSFEKAAELYRGDFLAGDGNDWSVSVRERMRDRFLRLIIRKGKSSEAEGDWERAARYYAKGLEIDDLTEELYQNLMTCYKNLGRHAEVVKVYNRCRASLNKSLGISPSARTEALKAGM